MNRALGEGVLYHAVSSYQLLEAMLHRRLFHREERATLLLPDFIVGKYPQWQRLEGPFFDRVALFPYLLIPHGEEGRVLADTAAAWQSLGLPPAESFFKRYVMGAHFYFSLYLEAKGLPFSFFEDAAGALSRPDQAAAILGRTPSSGRCSAAWKPRPASPSCPCRCGTFPWSGPWRPSPPGSDGGWCGFSCPSPSVAGERPCC